ncbi:hypothetical protein GDO86_018123 [Hymenochirus boettgeri]|uniref:Uncharacterized protein n=1 Tax=Hymenochirus boettgeri TaxID=247094 RepID=A0A8T2IFZ8_9PIPI|nr:hypothetical protein GDO86_018123 [Hymenochirus boettgeri]
MASADLRAEVTCCICMNIYKDPVTLPCGHNYCLECIQRTWDSQEHIDERPSCPECRQTYRRRPELTKNVRLRNIAEYMVSETTKHETSGIICSYCDSPVPAAKTCVLCEVSLCDNHVSLHSKSKEHVLTEPTASMEKMKCSVHKKILEYYCTDDSVCICVSCCLAGAHRGHTVELLEEASEKKKDKLKNLLQYMIPKRDKIEEDLENQQKSKAKIQKKSAAVKQRIASLFIKIKEYLEALEKQMVSEISQQEEKLVLPFSNLIQQLEEQKNKLSNIIRDIEEMCKMDEPLTVLQCEEWDRSSIFDYVKGRGKDDVIEIQYVGDQEEYEIKESLFTGLSELVPAVKERWVCGQKVMDMVLDVNTLDNNGRVSEDLKVVRFLKTDQGFLETLELFNCNEVLSTRGFNSGRHYWDVQGSELGKWCVGVSYAGVDREEENSLTGMNNKSWGLYQTNSKWFMGMLSGENQYFIMHNSRKWLLSDISPGGRFRISLDFDLGLLSFYEVNYTLRHLHTFSATFTEPLHAAFSGSESRIEIIS